MLFRWRFAALAVISVAGVAKVFEVFEGILEEPMLRWLRGRFGGDVVELEVCLVGMRLLMLAADGAA